MIMSNVSEYNNELEKSTSIGVQIEVSEVQRESDSDPMKS